MVGRLPVLISTGRIDAAFQLPECDIEMGILNIRIRSRARLRRRAPHQDGIDILANEWHAYGE
jgi:hypothetical protein